MVDQEAIRAGVLTECQDDYVGLWSVVRDVRRHMPHASSLEIKDTTLGILQELLAGREIVAGNPSPDGQGFEKWDLQPATVTARISSEWDRLGRDPDVGEIAWFTAPDDEAGFDIFDSKS